MTGDGSPGGDLCHGPATTGDGILAARARALAEPLEAPATAPGERALLRFSCGAGAYAVDAERVEEVVSLRGLLPLPGAPPAIAGVFVHRGRAVAVIDPGRIFRVDDDAGARSLVVVLNVPGVALGLSADGLAGVDRLATGLTTILDVDALAVDQGVLVDHRPD